MFGNKRGDLKSISIEGLKWDDANAHQSLMAVYDAAMTMADQAKEWYAKAKRPKKQSALVVRYVAGGLVGLAAVLPIVTEMLKHWAAVTWYPSMLWPSLLLGLAAALLAIDKAGDHSRGWVRYTLASTRLIHVSNTHKLEWPGIVAGLSSPPTKDEIQKALGKCSAFVASVDAIVTEETDAWVREFQSSLQELESQIGKAQADRVAAEAAERTERERERAIKSPGGINLTIANSAGVKGDVKASNGNGVEVKEALQGETAIMPLDPGLWKVWAGGTLADGKLVSGSIAVDVPGGKIVPAKVTLA